MKRKFENCLVISNSASTNVKRAMQMAGQLHDHFPSESINQVEISNLDYKQTERLLVKLSPGLSDKSLICIVGGDGTISTIVNILLTTPRFHDEARRAIILPLWGGNGNDLAIMANGALQRTSLKRILDRGSVTPIHPLSVTTQQIRSNQTKLKLAICYAGFGVTAKVSELINHKGYRQMRVYRLTGLRAMIEVGRALSAFLSARPFTAELGDNNTALYDLVLINGPRMAKRERFPVKITDKLFVEASVQRKLPGLFLYLLHAMNWRSTRPSKTERSLTVHDSIWMQLDGEVIKIPSHTNINIKFYDRPFYILSTKL